MNTLKITFTSFLLLATASVTQFASATGVQTPNFLTALATANEYNRAGNTAYDPNCEHGENGERGPAQARIWDAKLIDHDGDGVPDEDRIRAGEQGTEPLLAAGRLNLENGARLGTTYAVGRRHILTVAHAFAKDGRIIRNHEDMTVQIEGCGSEVYHIVERNLGSENPQRQDNRYKDYAVLELDRDICPQVTPLRFGVPSVEETENLELAATGYYDPATVSRVNNQSARANSGQVETTAPDASPFSDYVQYISFGTLDRSAVLRGQRVDAYKMGQEHGGSGGPITANIDGVETVVGMQFIEPLNPQHNYNFSIAAEGPFLDFVRQHVPDLDEYRPGTDI